MVGVCGCSQSDGVKGIGRGFANTRACEISSSPKALSCDTHLFKDHGRTPSINPVHVGQYSDSRCAPNHATYRQARDPRDAAKYDGSCASSGASKRGPIGKDDIGAANRMVSVTATGGPGLGGAMNAVLRRVNRVGREGISE